MPLTLEQKTVEYATLTQAALDVADRELRKHAAADKQAADAIPGVVDALIANDRLPPSQKAAAARICETHEGALSLLKKLAGHRNDAELHAQSMSLGRPLEEAGPAKRASARAIGGRETGRMPSDDAFLASLGISM